MPTMCQALGCALYEISLPPHRNCIVSTHFGVEVAAAWREWSQGDRASGGPSWHPACIYLAPKPTFFTIKLSCLQD